jgi:hypothetical protein
MTRKHEFKAGKYYVGDPCYAIPDEEWGSLLKDTGFFGLETDNTITNWDDGLYEYRGYTCFVDGTAYGDGVYCGQNGEEFGVDAGLIGIIPMDAIPNFDCDGGEEMTFEKDFDVWTEDGVFYFDELVIDTKGE